jgi:hypothetical protein
METVVIAAIDPGEMNAVGIIGAPPPEWAEIIITK